MSTLCCSMLPATRALPRSVYWLSRCSEGHSACAEALLDLSSLVDCFAECRQRSQEATAFAGCLAGQCRRSGVPQGAMLTPYSARVAARTGNRRRLTTEKKRVLNAASGCISAHCLDHMPESGGPISDKYVACVAHYCTS